MFLYILCCYLLPITHFDYQIITKCKFLSPFTFFGPVINLNMDKLGCQKGDIMNYARSLFIHYCNCKVVTLFTKRNIHNLLQYLRDSCSKSQAFDMLHKMLDGLIIWYTYSLVQQNNFIIFLRQITNFQNIATNWIMECVADNCKRL